MHWLAIQTEASLKSATRWLPSNQSLADIVSVPRTLSAKVDTICWQIGSGANTIRSQTQSTLILATKYSQQGVSWKEFFVVCNGQYSGNRWTLSLREYTVIQIRLALPRHAVTITQWHQVSWSHMLIYQVSSSFLTIYITAVYYTAVVTWQCQWQWKCMCGQAVQYPHFQNCNFKKSNSFGFGKLSPCKCGSYLGMYSAYPYIWINHWHFLFEHMHVAYTGPDPDSHNSRTPICGQAKQFHDILSVCPPLLYMLASIHFCNRGNDIQHSGISSID